MDSKELLHELKQRLKIDWDDDDSELTNLLEESIAYFKRLLGEKELDSDVTEFILERGRYAWNNALDEFEKNFSNELNALIQVYAFLDWRKKNEKNT